MIFHKPIKHSPIRIEEHIMTNYSINNTHSKMPLKISKGSTRNMELKMTTRKNFLNRITPTVVEISTMCYKFQEMHPMKI
jgi:hypothetical protein